MGQEGDLLDEVVQPVAILYFVQAMVDNGGFEYVFENDFPFSPPYSVFVSAYRKIGATEAADRLEMAVALFPFEDPHLHPEKRNEFMDSLDESHELFALGDEVCGNEEIWRLMEAYVRKHRAEFPR
jgi:hypothetical protein